MMDKKLSEELFQLYKVDALYGRYISHKQILPLIENMTNEVKISRIGKSVQNRTIHSIKIGEGETKVLMWSQMHGNESTTTKAVFDLLNTLIFTDNHEIKSIFKKCTLIVIPMLNPDGAEVYTRVNANEIDLNRDSVNLSQPESKALNKIFKSFEPDYCLNLHGQRTIFSAGKSKNPATISFLAPAQNEGRAISENRAQAMKLIVKMNQSLQTIIPDCVGRYDDTFNLNCVGDLFQSKGAATILFEAGHYKDDYSREFSRYLIYHSLLVCLKSIAVLDFEEIDLDDYSKIPENQKLYYDLIIRNCVIAQNGKSEEVDLAIQYQEKLKSDTIVYEPKIVKISKLNHNFGHKEINANGNAVSGVDGSELYEGYANDFVLIKNEKYSLKLENI